MHIKWPEGLIELELICGVSECFKLKLSAESLCGNVCVNMYVCKTFTQSLKFCCSGTLFVVSSLMQFSQHYEEIAESHPSTNENYINLADIHL